MPEIKGQATGDAPGRNWKDMAATGAGLRLGLRLLGVGPVLILAVLVVIPGLFAPHFRSGQNIANILAQTAVISDVVLGQHLVILTRGIDLSVGSNLALSSVAGALVFQAGGGAVTVTLAMMATGAAVGLVNGGVYVRGRLPHPFIITLATLSIAKGLALELADRRAVPGMPDAIRWLGRDGWSVCQGRFRWCWARHCCSGA